MIDYDKAYEEVIAGRANQAQPIEPAPSGGIDYEAAAKEFGGTVVESSDENGIFSSLEQYQEKPSFFGRAIRSILKPVAQLPVQFGRAAIAGAAGLAGNEELEAEFSKPYESEFFGEIKGLSAVPGHSEEYGTKTPLQTVGQAAELAATALMPAGAGKVGAAIGKQTLKKAVVEGAKHGAKAGALLGFSGAAEQENVPSIGDTIKSSVTGAVTGAAVGAAAGAVSYGITKAADKMIARYDKKTLLRSEQDALDIVREKPTPKEIQKALEEGRISREGLLRTEVVKPSRRDFEVAKAAEGLVKKGKKASENIAAIRSEISRISEKEIAPFLEKNNAIFNKKQLNTALKDVQMPTLFKSDPTMEKTYDLVRQRAMDVIGEHPNNMTGLLEARKAFDKLVDKEFPRLFDMEKDTVIKRAILDMRSGMNGYIAQHVPNGTANFTDLLRRQSLLFDAVENIAYKAKSGVGKNAVQRFMTQHPMMSTAVKVGIPTGLVGGTIMKGLNPSGSE